jgi:hypothetical protein
MRLAFLIFAAAVLAMPLFGQSQAVIPAAQNGETVAEVEDQPECPIRLSVKTLQGDFAHIEIYMEVVSEKEVIGFAAIQDSATKPNVFGNVSPATPFVKGGTPVPVSGVPLGSGRYVIRVDFVRFTDGTTWGRDELQQSKSINDFLEGWGLVSQRLREIASAYANPEFFIEISTHVRPGWSGRLNKDGDHLTAAKLPMKNMAYDSVLNTLRHHSTRDAEAQEIARKLELMRTPPPSNP